MVELKAKTPFEGLLPLTIGQAKLTEMDALVAYLQMIGTLVDFETGEAQEQPR